MTFLLGICLCLGPTMTILLGICLCLGPTFYRTGY
jgi:hypothetical protein